MISTHLTRGSEPQGATDSCRKVALCRRRRAEARDRRRDQDQSIRLAAVDRARPRARASARLVHISGASSPKNPRCGRMLQPCLLSVIACVPRFPRIDGRPIDARPPDPAPGSRSYPEKCGIGAWQVPPLSPLRAESIGLRTFAPRPPRLRMMPRIVVLRPFFEPALSIQVQRPTSPRPMPQRTSAAAP
jgi:hypothetical protein